MSLETTLADYSTMLENHKALMNNLINKSTFDNKQREQNNKISTLERNVTVSLKSNRYTNGTWTISNLTINKPLFITHSKGNNAAASNCQAKVISGSNDCIGGGKSYILGINGSSACMIIVPTSTTVVLEVSHMDSSDTQDYLRAYQ